VEEGKRGGGRKKVVNAAKHSHIKSSPVPGSLLNTQLKAIQTTTTTQYLLYFTRHSR
jgi:hypothetical protein